MKKLILMITAILLLQSLPINGSKEIDTIATLFTEKGFSIEEWQVTMIDKLSVEKFEKLKKKLEISYLATVNKSDSTVKYIFDAKNSNRTIHNYFEIIVPNNGDDITVQTIISGTKWDHSIESYYNNLSKQLKRQYSLPFNNIFTCIKLDDNGIIRNGFSNNKIEKIWKEMNVKNKNEYVDNVQQSAYDKNVYGYTPLWNSKIIVQEEPVNFQMIVKTNEKEKRQVIIGTPIILNEY